MRRLALVLIFSVASARLHADSKKLTEDQRIEILRGLSSEYAKIKVQLPRTKKILEFSTDGTWDHDGDDALNFPTCPSAPRVRTAGDATRTIAIGRVWRSASIPQPTVSSASGFQAATPDFLSGRPARASPP